jgi:hypothetical protein
MPAIGRVEVRFPCAVELARLGAEAVPTGGAVEPLYLKPAHITTPKPLRRAGK